MQNDKSYKSFLVWLIVTIVLGLLTAYFLNLSNQEGNNLASICGNNDEPCVVIYANAEKNDGNRGVLFLVLTVASGFITLSVGANKITKQK